MIHGPLSIEDAIEQNKDQPVFLNFPTQRERALFLWGKLNFQFSSEEIEMALDEHLPLPKYDLTKDVIYALLTFGFGYYLPGFTLQMLANRLLVDEILDPLSERLGIPKGIFNLPAQLLNLASAMGYANSVAARLPIKQWGDHYIPLAANTVSKGVYFLAPAAVVSFRRLFPTGIVNECKKPRRPELG